MPLISFRDWKKTTVESSAFTRSRQQAMLGLGPDIPDASLHSRSTASPWMVEKAKKKSKKKKKKKLTESKSKSPDYSFDDFLKKVTTVEDLSKELKKKKKKGKNGFGFPFGFYGYLGGDYKNREEDKDDKDDEEKEDQDLDDISDGGDADGGGDSGGGD